MRKPVNVDPPHGLRQPALLSLPDSQSFLYTAAETAGGTDIYRRSPAIACHCVRVTRTPESEYSPTPFGSPAAGFLRAVRVVEADSTQRLWRFDMDGKNPALVMSDVDSVGYFSARIG